jgi:hypothetical protein
LDALIAKIDRLRDRLGVGARKPINERPAGRLVFKIDIGERSTAGVFYSVGLGGLADAQSRT